MLACIRTCRMVGRHAPCAMCPGGQGGSICRGVRRGPERRRPGWANQTNKKTCLACLWALHQIAAATLGRGGARTPSSREQCLAVTSHLHPSVRGNVREDAW